MCIVNLETKETLENMCIVKTLLVQMNVFILGYVPFKAHLQEQKTIAKRLFITARVAKRANVIFSQGCVTSTPVQGVGGQHQ